MKQIRRRSFLAMLTAGSAGTALAGPLNMPRPRMRPDNLGEVVAPGPASVVEDARVTGESHFAVADLDTGALLEDYRKDKPLPPASVAKTVTTLYAINTLGRDHRFVTRVLATGPMQGGRIEGDLILAGGGDPVLDTRDLAELAAALKAAGVTEVTGRYLYHGTALPEARLIDEAQPDQVGYNPGVSGLNLNFNRVHFEWKREGGRWVTTMDARAGNYRPDVTVARMTIADRAGPVYTYADEAGVDAWTVASGALGTGGARWLPVRRPAAYAAEVFQVLVRAHGIVLKAPEPVEALPEVTYQMASHRSPPLIEIAEDMLYYSTNLTAELLGLAASVARASAPGLMASAKALSEGMDSPDTAVMAESLSGKLTEVRDTAVPHPPRPELVTATTSQTMPASLRDSAAAMSLWARQHFGLTSIDLVDHSGLGEASGISTGDLVRMLLSPEAQRDLQPILKEISVKDELGRPIQNGPVKVHAKTGTLNFVSALAGYEKASDGRMLAFAVISADIEKRDALTRAQRERPPGGRAWLTRARALQQDLIRRWDGVYGTG
ncbi:D-alanyl-D-alanine carboxypeptidase/D-alanyl-D-alanine-endopeptidase [Pseudooceanicola sp. HF7]|uniref:D-alanyl-D-alanine carboxypeptidase/D-alanyl-D-alanine endopeptidase n=1 Tax=Pseudooceanicola sp. HF7 TaxID=2721560 RepID=UPI0020CA452E|nr:D-alanyl-D-alanine carboxypeptidase/D-alanyl-D-alanine-endopeptidase [Pseudooceanicola sp. HF7]